MKFCELCTSKARIHCQSDEASLCWDCDFKVHSANFLVAKHIRTLLCHDCQCPTPWNASGEKLGRTISVCEGCVGGSVGKEESHGGNDDEIVTLSGGESEDEFKHQLAPMSDTSDSPATSSSSEVSSRRFFDDGRVFDLKLLRENCPDLYSEGDLESYSCDENSKFTDAVAERCLESSLIESIHGRALKRQKTFDLNQFPDDDQESTRYSI